jgi:hypothetical protein
LFWSFLPEAADAMDMAGSYIRELQGGRAQASPEPAAASTRAR